MRSGGRIVDGADGRVPVTVQNGTVDVGRKGGGGGRRREGIEIVHAFRG